MKRKLYLLFVMLLAVTIIPVSAKTDNFIADESVSLNDPIDATSFVAGNNVDISSRIDGASFIAGQNLKIKSKQDILFAAGNTLHVSGVETKDAFLAGSSIELSESNIRDLYAAASSITVNSNINRNAFLGADVVTINSVVNGDLYIAADTIEIKDNAEILGTLKYPKDAKTNISSDAKINDTKTYERDSSSDDDDSVAEAIKSAIYTFLSMLLIGLILLALNKNVFTRISKMKTDGVNVLKNIGIGFCFLVVLPIAAIILMITVIAIPLSIISLIMYGVMIYLTAIPTAYFFGNLLLKDKIENKYLLFTVSLLALYILKTIPVIGGLTTFLTICFGLGIYLALIVEQIKKK